MGDAAIVVLEASLEEEGVRQHGPETALGGDGVYGHAAVLDIDGDRGADDDLSAPAKEGLLRWLDPHVVAAVIPLRLADLVGRVVPDAVVRPRDGVFVDAE